MLYTFQGLRLMICIWIAVPLVCLVSVLIKLFRCKAEPQAPAVSVTRGQTITFSIRIKNRGVLPVAGVRADMRWRFRGAKDMRQRNQLRGISGRSGRKIEFEFQTAHCRRVEATVAKARMYDCLGLFSVPLRRGGSISIPVMPVYVPMSENEMERIVGFLNARGRRGDGDRIVREYRPGDGGAPQEQDQTGADEIPDDTVGEKTQPSVDNPTEEMPQDGADDGSGTTGNGTDGAGEAGNGNGGTDAAGSGSAGNGMSGNAGGKAGVQKPHWELSPQAKAALKKVFGTIGKLLLCSATLWLLRKGCYWRMCRAAV